MLEANRYVRVFALDFSKAFDTIRHSTLLEKMSKYNLPDHMYNWSVDFFNDHSHCTTFQGLTSSLMNTNAGVIQGSAMGPASFVITASDLTTAGFDNKLKKYADDTYLICPSNSEVCAENELNKIEAWALVNNLKLNTKKSVEIVFVKPRSKAVKEIEELPIVKGINRVQSINILGIIISNNFGMKNHIDAVVSNCSSSLFALRTLRFHGLPLEALQLVFKAKILSKLQYCSSAWWGFTTSSDRQRIESFLKRCVKNGYYNSDDLSFAELVLNSDNNLFNSIKSNPHHMLHNLLPTKISDVSKTAIIILTI